MDRRACVWIRLLYALIGVWAISVAGHFADQNRYGVVLLLGARELALMHDARRNEFFLLPLPHLQNPDSMLREPSVPENPKRES